MTQRSRLLSLPGLVLGALTLVLVPTSAFADSSDAATSQFSLPPSPGQPGPVSYGSQSRFREGKGWFLGGDFALGGVAATWDNGLDQGGSALFFHLRFGGKLSQRLGLSVELWSDGYDNEGDFGEIQRYTQNVVALAVSYWLMPRFWVTTGLGSATLRDYSGPETIPTDGSGFMVGMGYELFAREKYSIDATLRLISSSYDMEWATMGRTSFAVGVGATWH